jgi:GT2 family glycosyltransferase
MNGKEIVFVTVNYHNSNDTLQLVESLAKLENFDKCQIVIVDNESTFESQSELEKLKMKYPNNVITFYLPENLFYWGGANFAINKLFSDINLMPKWLIVCNNDIVIEQADFITKLLSIDFEKYTIIGPSITSLATGLDQNPFRITPIKPFELFIWRIFFRHYYIAFFMLKCRDLLKKIFKINSKHKNKFITERIIYAPHGAFVIFSKTFFEKGGKLDTNFKLWGEENTLAETARRIGVPIYYFPSLKVIHKEHLAVGQNFTKDKFRYAKEAFEYFYTTYLKK